MLGINTCEEDLFRKKAVMYVDVWDHFNRDRSLYSKDGLHLNRGGKERLGRVLDDGVKKELERNRTKALNEEIPPGQAGSGHFLEPVEGRSDEVAGGERDVRLAGVQIGERKVGGVREVRSAGVQIGEGEAGGAREVRSADVQVRLGMGR